MVNSVNLVFRFFGRKIKNKKGFFKVLVKCKKALLIISYHIIFQLLRCLEGVFVVQSTFLILFSCRKTKKTHKPQSVSRGGLGRLVGLL